MTIDEHVDGVDRPGLIDSVSITKVNNDAARLLRERGLQALDNCKVRPYVREAEQLIDLDLEIVSAYKTMREYRH